MVFEKDLEALSVFLERPYPEFFGGQVNDQPGGELQWVIVPDLRGKMEPPRSERIQFSVRGNNWLDGLARAVHEALARLCGQSINQIKGTRFEFYPRCDANGQPLQPPSHPQMRRVVEDISFLLYDRQTELDNARRVSNQKSALAIQRNHTIDRLLKKYKKDRRRLHKKKCLIARLRHKISAMEYIIQKHDMDLDSTEDEGADITGDPYSYLSDDDDFEEDQDIDSVTDNDDANFINDEDEEAEPTDSEE